MTGIWIAAAFVGGYVTGRLWPAYRVARTSGESGGRAALSAVLGALHLK